MPRVLDELRLHQGLTWVASYMYRPEEQVRCLVITPLLLVPKISFQRVSKGPCWPIPKCVGATYRYDCIPILNTRYVTDSYWLFIDITLNNRLISPILISTIFPIPIQILGDCFITIQIPIHTDSFYTDTGYRYRYIVSYRVSLEL